MDDRVDRYRLIARIGAGGMGEVYRAHDERLRRQVAVKLLPSDRAVPPERQLRFLREAQAAGTLHHPGIVTIHDIGLHGDRPFLVMELVEGKSFSELAHARVPSGEALRLVAEVADALAAAHDRGILHRDVKSDNLMRTEDGRAKIVDFGLAKLLDPRGIDDSGDALVAHLISSSGGARSEGEPAVSPSDSTTLPSAVQPGLDATLPSGADVALTRVGDVMGTPAYMAPEQTEGAPVTVQGEIFSLGVVLYELLVGRRPFSGATVAETLQRVIECRPVAPSVALGRALPKGVDRLVLQALSRDPADRPADMRAFSAALRALGQRSAPWGKRAAAAAALLATAGVTLALTLSSRAPAVTPRPATAPTPAFTFRPKNLRRVTFGEGCEEFPSVSADGRTVVFDGAEGHDYHLFVLDVATGAQRRLTSGAGWQFAGALSPDGRDVAFLGVDQGQTAAYLVPLDASAPPRLLHEGSVRPAWVPDGSALWLGPVERPVRVDRAAKELRPLEPPRGFVISQVRELRDGRVAVRFMETGAGGGIGIGLYEPGRGEPRWLMRDTVEEVLEATPDDQRLLVARMTTNHRMELWQIPLAGGEPTPLPTSEVQAAKGLVLTRDMTRMAWSSCSGLAAFATVRDGPAGPMLAPLPRNTSEDWAEQSPAGVPGTSLLAMTSDRTGQDQPWVMDLRGREPARMLAVPGLESGYVAVSPDRRWLAYAVFGRGLYVRPFDRDGAARRIAEDCGDAPPAFSRDGRRVFYEARDGGGLTQLAVVAVDGGKPEHVFEAGARAPSTAADRDLVAYLAPAGAGKHVPRLHDLTTRRSRALSPELVAGRYLAAQLSPDGKRAAVIRGPKELVEVEVSSGRVLRRIDAGGDQLLGCTYADGQLVVSRVAWRGDLWMADDAFR